jgi:hypothetical protein
MDAALGPTFIRHLGRGDNDSVDLGGRDLVSLELRDGQAIDS